MFTLERYKAGKLTALLTWHGTFLTHVYVGDALGHQSLDLASGEQPNLLLDSAVLEAHTPDGFRLIKVNSLPIAFPKLRLLSNNDRFISFQCVDGYNLYPNGKGHLMTAEEKTGRIYMDRDVEKEWEQFIPVSFQLMSGLSVLLACGRLAGQAESSVGSFRLHVGATLTYGPHVFSINLNRDLILRIGNKTLTFNKNLSSEHVLLLIRDITGLDHEIYV